MADSLTFVRVVQVVDRADGALVVYTKNRYLNGDTVTLKEIGNQEEDYFAQMTEFSADDGTRVYAAIFPRLPHANYVINPGYSTNWGRTTVFAGTVVAFEKK